MILPLSRRSNGYPRDCRAQMLAETGAFLTWALRERPNLPRIPRRRVDEGGFAGLLRLPGARAAVARWWDAALDQVRM